MPKITLSKNTVLVSIAAIGIIAAAVLIYTGSQSNSSFSNFLVFGQSNEQVGKKAVDYINSNDLTGGAKASLVGVSEQSGLIKIKIKIGSNEFDSYVTKDGKLLFPQALDISKTAENQQDQALTKSDSPLLEAYVVSRCPYGIQMQRAMADAVKNIPALEKHLKVRYIGSVSSDGNKIIAMHGDEEAKENLRQICIREEQSGKYWDYVSCQMKAGDTAGCEKSSGVDSSKLNACVSDASRGVAFAKKDFDLGAKYNVKGSPTLTLNGALANESDFGGRSSDGVKSMVCAAFNSQAGFCSEKLNTATAAVSFSATYGGSTTAPDDETGKTTHDNGGCAPAQ